MRILQATDCYPPPLVGGRDLHVSMLAHELHQRGHEVEVLALAGSSGPSTEMDGAIRVHRMAGWGRALSRFYVDPDRPFHPTIPDPGLVASLAELVRQYRPEIVHAHSWFLNSLLPILPSLQTRLVVTMHDYGLLCPKGTFVYKDGVCEGPKYLTCVSCASGQYGAVRSIALTTGLAMMRRSYRRVDRYIAVSNPVVRACSSVPGGRRSIEVIPPFISDDSLHPADQTRPSFVPPTGGYIMFARVR